MGFELAYRDFIRRHESRRSGERLRRLREGHRHAEQLFLRNVWWPAVGDFRGLHPEYELIDSGDTHRFLDFAYFRARFKVAFEIDGFGPHARNASRTQFENQLFRQNDLLLDGWMVLRFPYDAVESRARRCQQVIHRMMSQWIKVNDRTEVVAQTLLGREILRLAAALPRDVTPADVVKWVGVCRDTAYQALHKLVEAGCLVPTRGKRRVRAYRLSDAASSRTWGSR